jgi:hypothetical protein
MGVHAAICDLEGKGLYRIDIVLHMANMSINSVVCHRQGREEMKLGKKAYCFQLSPETDAMIDKLAAKKHVTRGEIVTRAIIIMNDRDNINLKV